MDTSDLLKEPILSSANGAHDSSKEVDVLQPAEKVSDMKEQSLNSLKDTSPVINKEFNFGLSDRKELTPEPISKEESPLHSSKESSPLNLSKEPSPLPSRKEQEETSVREEPIVSLAKESSPLLDDTKDVLIADISEKPEIKSTEAFMLSESADTNSQTSSLLNESSVPQTINTKESDPLTSSSFETKVFPSSISPEPSLELEKTKSEPVKKEEDDSFGFNKPLPPEPIESTADFLRSETNFNTDENETKPMTTPKVIANDDFLTDPTSTTKDEDLARKSPSPPPVPKHQNLRDDSSERYEPSQTPEPDFAAFKPVTSSVEDKFGDPVEIDEPIDLPTTKPESTFDKPKEPSVKKEDLPPTPAPKKKDLSPVESSEVIGAKDIRSKIDAWFNPARLHPQVESLIYWRDPKKSGIVFGVAMVSLLSLTYYSLISVVAYLCIFTLGGTITFRVYKNIMQAVQKTSDGHPFKDLLEVDLTLPEEKVTEMSQSLVQYMNASLTTLRSLFLVEDLIDSIKFFVLLWVLTYVGACFNGLTLIIIGVVLLFSLPKVYENNKAQIDIYVKMAMDKLSIITHRMKAAVPEGKKDDKTKPKDQ